MVHEKTVRDVLMCMRTSTCLLTLLAASFCLHDRPTVATSPGNNTAALSGRAVGTGSTGASAVYDDPAWGQAHGKDLHVLGFSDANKRTVAAWLQLQGARVVSYLPEVRPLSA